MPESKTPSLVFLMVYFGKWPEWIDLFLESCRWNPTIRWIFFTDCGQPDQSCHNVEFVPMSRREMSERIRRRLGVNHTLEDAYKLNDFKPAYGLLFEDYLDGVDCLGYGDIDVVYGDIRKFYTSEVLDHDVISTHPNHICGHLCVMKNTRPVTTAFRRVRRWRERLENPQYTCFEEGAFSRLVLRGRRYPRLIRPLMSVLGRPCLSVLAEERYSTNLAADLSWTDGTREYPSEWIWRDGHLTNNKDGEREFLYLHFMNWKSSRYLVKEMGQKAAWETLDRINRTTGADISRGFTISRRGFFPMGQTADFSEQNTGSLDPSKSPVGHVVQCSSAA